MESHMENSTSTLELEAEDSDSMKEFREQARSAREARQVSENLRNSDRTGEGPEQKQDVPMVSFRPKGREMDDLKYLEDDLGISKSRAIGLAIREYAHQQRVKGKERELATTR